MDERQESLLKGYEKRYILNETKKNYFKLLKLVDTLQLEEQLTEIEKESFKSDLIELAYILTINPEYIEEQIKAVESTEELKALLDDSIKNNNYPNFRDNFDIVENITTRESIKNYLQPIDALTRKLKNGSGKHLLYDTKHKLESYFEITPPEYTDKPINSFDIAVLSIIFNLAYIGNSYFTVNEIAIYLKGESGNTKKLRERIEKSIEKMRHTDIIIDNSDEIKKYTYGHFNLCKQKDSLLALRQTTLRHRNGNYFKGYKINNCIYFDWINTRQGIEENRNPQIYTIKTEQLKTKLYLTSDNLEIIQYIRWQIKAQKSPFTMKFESIKNNLTHKARNDRLLKTVITFLDESKENGLIKGYKLKENNDIFITS